MITIQNLSAKVFAFNFCVTAFCWLWIPGVFSSGERVNDSQAFIRYILSAPAILYLAFGAVALSLFGAVAGIIEGMRYSQKRKLVILFVALNLIVGMVAWHNSYVIQYREWRRSLER